jgi:chorismate mutase
MDIEALEEWGFGRGPLIIAGPCSAESEQQVISTARALKATGMVHLFRSGIWKPRSRPGAFSGEGTHALKWLQAAKQETGLPMAVEVASPKHVEECLKHSIDVVWLGARTVSNPFSVDEIANALKGTSLPVMVKNPLGPDLELWLGAVERLYAHGIRKLAGVHRGFTPYEITQYRNVPKWELAIELRSRIPSLPVICDPSHMSGRADLVPQVSQKALDMNMGGLMIEVHNNPEEALSDREQQLDPKGFETMMKNLIFRTPSSDDLGFRNHLEELRARIDSIDHQIIELVATRMNISGKMGEYKCRENVTVFQLDRWLEILQSRIEHGVHAGLEKDFIEHLIKVIHEESIRCQDKVMDTLRRSGRCPGAPDCTKNKGDKDI